MTIMREVKFLGKLFGENTCCTCFYNNTIHIVEMFYDKNCQVYDVFTLLDSVYLYEDTVHIVKKIVL